MRVLAGMHVNVWDTIDAVQQLVRDRTGGLDWQSLAETCVPLDEVAPAHGRAGRLRKLRGAPLRWTGREIDFAAASTTRT